MTRSIVSQGGLTREPSNDSDNGNLVVQKSFNEGDLGLENESNKPIINYLPYQREWLDDKSRFKIGMWARQTGKSLCATGEIAGDAMLNAGTLWILVSAGEAQAKELLMKTAGYIQLANAVASIYTETEKKLEETITRHIIELKNGSRIISVANNPDTIRGYSGNVYWDEAAIGKNSSEMWKAIFPIISNGFRLLITSTPKGKQGEFYRIFSADDKLWSRHFVDVEMAVAQGLDRDLEILRIGAGDEQTWRQEYMLEWLDEAHAFLPFDDIMACESKECLNIINMGGFATYASVGLSGRHQPRDDAPHTPHRYTRQEVLSNSGGIIKGGIDKVGNPTDMTAEKSIRTPLDTVNAPLNNKGIYFIGIDIARRNDLWVLVVLEKVGDVLWTRKIIAERNMPFAKQETVLDGVMKKYNPIRGGIDQTGMGEQFVERAQLKYGKSRIEGIIFSAPRKLDMASLMKKRFEDRKIRIPAGDNDLRNDLHAIQMKPSITGAPRLIDDGTSDGHADRFWAYAMAIAVAETEPQQIDYINIPMRTNKVTEEFING